jgi:hypothetical protein
LIDGVVLRLVRERCKKKNILLDGVTAPRPSIRSYENVC